MPLARFAALGTAVALLVTLGTALAGGAVVPGWAFPVNPPGHPPPADDGKIRSLPGSSAKFSFAELRNFFSPPDWYPEDHPVMPPLVAHGAKPSSFACGFCHLPTGNGRPENANIAGLPAPYIIQQVKDIQSGARRSTFPDRYPQSLMTKLSMQAATEPGLAEAAAYFAAMKPKSMTKIVEADEIPKVEITHWIFRKANEGGTEPLGERLIEVPDDFKRFEARDGHTTYTAYVPKGSISKGEVLVKTGGTGTTIACSTCHGVDLKGFGPAPPIAGRSPSYISRQLFDFQTGSRNGEAAILMKPVVEKLANSEIIAITAYLGTLEP